MSVKAILRQLYCRETRKACGRRHTRPWVLRNQVLMRTFIVAFLSIATATAALGADDRAPEVDQLFAMFDKQGSPGCSVGVIRDGDFVYKRSFGYASLELGVPLTPASVFYMASVSKQFTAASIVLAAEQGHLSLDDDVRKYLPELPDYGRRITLRQMLHQTSGFRDFLDLVFISGRNAADLASPGEILKLIARQKGLNNVPGAEWVYSNSNYFLLGEVIRRATGKSLGQFAAENIFQPLGMTYTLFYEDNTRVVPNRVAAYDPGEEGYEMNPPPDGSVHFSAARGYRDILSAIEMQVLSRLVHQL
jgi:CubicO group peptidase (beta-lactamase class C family)